MNKRNWAEIFFLILIAYFVMGWADFTLASVVCIPLLIVCTLGWLFGDKI